MGKLKIDSNKVNSGGANREDLIKTISKLKEQIKDYETEGKQKLAIEKINALAEAINNITDIEDTEKTQALKKIAFEYFKFFKSDNLSCDYDVLTCEAQFFSIMSQGNFLLMAERLKKIRDEELYKNNYNDFKSFIQNEMSISKSTVYNYLNIIDCFGVQPVGLGDNIEYTKLLPYIPLIKSDQINDSEKIELKKEALNYLKKGTSKQDIITRVKEKKNKYGLVKIESKFNILKECDIFINKIRERLNEDIKKEDYEALKELSKKIRDIIIEKGDL